MGHVAMKWETKNSYGIVGKLGKRLLGRPRNSLENNNKIDLIEVVFEDGRWMEPAQDYI